MRKPVKEVCGHCGRAVPPDRPWCDAFVGADPGRGHEYDEDDKLVKVRCFECRAKFPDFEYDIPEKPGNP